MGPLTYQRIAGLAGITLFIHILLSYTTYNTHNNRPADTTPFAVNHQHSTSTSPQPLPDSSNCSHEWSTSAKKWEFNAARDAHNYGLSPEQCDAAFPGMWVELDRAVAHRKKVGNITPAHIMIDWKIDGIIRAMIYDRQLFILDTKGVQRRDYRQRSIAVLQSIQRAITAFPGDIPNIEFSFVVDDSAYFAVNEENTRATTWALTREPKDKDKNLWLMPDFGFYSWQGPAGEYASLLRSIKENEIPFEKKDMRAVWRGAKSPAGPVKVRDDLLKVSKGRSWADIEAIQWGGSEPANLIPLPKHCRYMFTVHTEGHTYSGRLKYLLNCHSLTIIHKLYWVENFHHLLIPSGPDQNFIEVKRDFSDLEQKVQYYLQHQDEARRVADNSVKTFRDRYLTPAAQACYWRKMFHSWKEVSFEPSFYMTLEEEKLNRNGKRGRDSKLDNRTSYSTGENTSSRDKIPRGMPYETYILLEAYEDNPWYKGEATKLD